MKLPKLRQNAQERQTVDVFGGYNHNLRIGDGEFYEMQNMTSDHYPLLSPRKCRSVYMSAGMVQEFHAIAVTGEGLCYINRGSHGNTYLQLPSTHYLELNATEEVRKIVPMGAYIIILPDKVWVNVAKCMGAEIGPVPDDAYGNIEAVLKDATVRFELCREDGTVYTQEEIALAKPSNPSDGQLWLDGSGEENVLKIWVDEMNMWTIVSNTYLKISASDIHTIFDVGDTIEIPSDTKIALIKDLFGRKVVRNKGTEDSTAASGFIVVEGEFSRAAVIGAVATGVTITRTMPDMDFIIESGNRLWGCKYGNTENGFVNEIYASKLGDFKNWHSFQGISTDSYVASIGADGPFTGAICYQGRPVFFKENCMIEVYGSYPAAYQVQTTPCDGVQSGCGKSLAIVNNILYYKSRGGVCAFDGSLPVQMGQALGSVQYENAIAGGCGSKYYISMQEAGTENWHLFVFDAAKGLWHREDDLCAADFCTYKNELYCLTAKGKYVYKMLGSGVQDDRPVQWMVQSGEIGLSLPDMKYISRLTVRLSLEEGSEVSFYVQYDFKEEWEHICTVPGTGLRSFSIPIRPKRCDHMKLRIEGIGGAKLYSITKTIEQGSDVS